MKKLCILAAFAALPFLLVWAAFVLTGFNFNPRNVFNEEAFWGFSTMYWFLYVCLIGLIVEIIDESVPVEPKETSITFKELNRFLEKELPGYKNPAK